MVNDKSLEKLEQRAKKAGRAFEAREIKYENDLELIYYIYIPAGPVERRIYVGSRANDFLSIDFEKYTFLGDFDTIVDLATGEIEAALTSREGMGNSFIERQLGFRSMSALEVDQDVNEGKDFVLQAESTDGIRLEISKGSEALRVLALRGGSVSSLSLKIYLGKPQDHDTALSTLEAISNALFFQIDLERGATLSLRKSLLKRNKGDLYT